MNNQLQIFEKKEFGTIRAIEIKGQIWFVGKDIAEILGYEAERNAIKQHVDDEDKLTHQISASGQSRNMIIINESGLYSLILSSKLPAAKAFKRWVTSDILPSIRKHGAYITDNTLDDLLSNPDTAIKLFTTLKDEREKKEALEKQIEIIAPKAQYCDLILQCDTAIPVTIIAKDYGMSATALNKLLHDLKVQYKVDGIWVLYQKHSNQGYTVTQTHYVNNDQIAIPHTYWTQKGRKFLYDFLKYYNILPEIEKRGA
jgi:prophage antirepressor-like protein